MSVQQPDASEAGAHRTTALIQVNGDEWLQRADAPSLSPSEMSRWAVLASPRGTGCPKTVEARGLARPEACLTWGRRQTHPSARLFRNRAVRTPLFRPERSRYHSSSLALHRTPQCQRGRGPREERGFEPGACPPLKSRGSGHLALSPTC